MKKGFSLVELMIVLAVIGILAAIVVPQVQSHTTQAKEAAARNNLNLMRAAIRLYAARHGVPPGYPGNDPTQTPAFLSLISQTVRPDLVERYISTWPENPFNELKTTWVLADDENFPPDATGSYGWIYQPAAKTIRLDWPGTDKSNIRYYDY